MIELDRLVAFAGAAFIVIVIPGPSVLFVIGRAVAHGRRAALATVFGNACGVYVQAIGVAVGVGALVERSITVYTVLRLVGASYLVYLGAQAIIHRHEIQSHSIHSPVPPTRRRFREGAVVGVTNPKGFVLFTAILPQFVDADAGHVTIQMLVFAFVAIVIAVASDSSWAMAAGTARDWFARSARRGELVSTVGGTTMIGLGLHLAVSQRAE